MDNKIKLIELCSSIGVFFGSCDGDYCESEKRIISKFISNYKVNDTIKSEIEKIENCALEKTHTIEEIIDESNQALDSLDAEKRAYARELLSQLIDAVINADGVLHPNEVKFYEQWKNSVR